MSIWPTREQAGLKPDKQPVSEVCSTIRGSLQSSPRSSPLAGLASPDALAAYHTLLWGWDLADMPWLARGGGGWSCLVRTTTSARAGSQWAARWWAATSAPRYPAPCLPHSIMHHISNTFQRAAGLLLKLWQRPRHRTRLARSLHVHAMRIAGTARMYIRGGVL